jgi:organic hydroperoxide reductase OsmC/OhrA
MKPLRHQYEATLSGGPSGYARASAANLPDLPLAPPVEFGGPGDAWSPEHLLLASVESCFLFTLRAVARASLLEFERVEVATSGIVEKADGRLLFTDIVLRATVTVPPGTDVERAEQLMEKSKRVCLVSQSLQTPVRLEAHVVVGDGDLVTL